MAEASPLEKTIQTAPQQAKKEEQKPITIESLLNETGHLGKSLLNLGLAGALTLSLATAVPSYARDIYIRTGAQIAADTTTNFKKGQKTNTREILNSAAVGGLVTFPVAETYKLVNKIPAETVLGHVGKGALFGALYAPFVGIYQTIDYLVRNLTFRGLGGYLKENYWPTLKRAWKLIFPLDVLVALFFPAYLQIPASALITYAYALFGAPKKGEVPEEKKRGKIPYVVAASNIIGKLGYKLFWFPLNTAYALGSGARNLYESFIRSPVTAPATQRIALQPA